MLLRWCKRCHRFYCKMPFHNTFILIKIHSSTAKIQTKHTFDLHWQSNLQFQFLCSILLRYFRFDFISLWNNPKKWWAWILSFVLEMFGKVNKSTKTKPKEMNASILVNKNLLSSTINCIQFTQIYHKALATVNKTSHFLYSVCW